MNRVGRQMLAVGVAASGLALTTPSAFAADITVRPGDITAGTPWSVSPNNTGTVGIGALADPIHFDGSAHLQIAGGERAQLQHRIVERLSQVAAQPLSYQVYVDPAGTTPDAVASAVNLQLEVGAPIFTTLSFQPQLAGGSAAGEWRTFVNSPTSLWRTSRAVGSLAAGTDHTLADYIAAQGPNGIVINSYLTIGTLGDPAATVNAYADNVSVGGDTYNFATDGTAQATITAPSTLEPGESAPVALTFSSPADGPAILDPSAVFTVQGPSSLRTRDFTVSVAGRRLVFTRGSDGTYSARVMLDGGSGDTLEPGASLSAALLLRLRDDAPCGTYVLSGELFSDGAPTGIAAHHTATSPCSGSTTPPPGSGNGGGPGGPGRPGTPGDDLAATGVWSVATLVWSGIASLVIGLGISLLSHRWTTRHSLMRSTGRGTSPVG
jgi:hypothetical protein